MTEVLLARHGETDWNLELRLQGSTDTELNETGRAQARELAERLADVPLDAVYASDLARARETAEIVAAPRGLAVQTDRDLRETSFGAWEGLTRDELERRYPDRQRPPDAESREQVRTRVVAAINRIVARHPGERVLVVSHGGALNALWHHTTGARLERWDNCAVYRLALRDGALVPVD